MLSEEESVEIKQKIISHIESTFPAEQIASSRSQIESMNIEQLEEFIKKNNLVKEEESASEEKCVFCAIASDKIKSVRIDENDKAIAILDINPISRGHALIIPKEHTDTISKEISSLAEKVSKELKNKFNPKKVEISKSKILGHEVIALLPVYEGENFESERKRATMEELEMVKEDLLREEKIEEVSKPLIEKIKDFWLPKRIP